MRVKDGLMGVYGDRGSRGHPRSKFPGAAKVTFSIKILQKMTQFFFFGACGAQIPGHWGTCLRVCVCVGMDDAIIEGSPCCSVMA